MDLYEKSKKTLELNQVLEKIAGHAVSDMAKDAVMQIRPYSDMDDIREHMREISDAIKLTSSRDAPMFSGLRDVSVQLMRAERGGVLNCKDLLRVAEVLRCARALSQYGDPSERRDGLTTCLDRYFKSLSINKYLEDTISNAILSEDEIADTASGELAQIRRKMRMTNSRVREVLHRIVTSPSYNKALQDTIITQRSGRFVVPVRAECKGEMPGLVHDVSASGATLFIEPSQVVEANNELKLLEAKEQKEIERVLAELSNEVAGFSGGIQEDMRILTYLDAVFAKAKYSLANDCYEPELSEGFVLDLRRARHPLLNKDTAVPIDIRLGGDFDTLVITGPNTGGKTVALKTLGLLTLMAQCGLHIPADETSTVSLFTRIFADIGDEQSISQSLSTFSSHMTNIVAILNQLDARSLVLFDELGAGTDPTEGAALATAIIEHVRSQGALVAATTHYAELKMYALTEEGVENAACEFDIETLKPTYRLLIGVPGKSNAFAISSRLGLDDRIIESARASLSGESIRFEQVLSDLESKRQSMEKELAATAKARIDMEKRQREAETKEIKLEKQSEEALEKAKREAQKIVADARAASEETFQELTKLKKQAAAKQFAIDVVGERAKVSGNLNKKTRTLVPDAPSQAIRRQRSVTAGDIVEISGSGAKGTVISGPDKSGNVTLQAGIMVITAKENTLRILENENKKERVKFKPREGGDSVVSHTMGASTTLDIRGMNADEAQIELERFIDAAQLSKLSPLTIIHGKGTGVLRQAVQKYLKRDKRVVSQRPGKYGEGEAGVTVAELKL